LSYWFKLTELSVNYFYAMRSGNYQIR